MEGFAAGQGRAGGAARKLGASTRQRLLSKVSKMIGCTVGTTSPVEGLSIDQPPVGGGNPPGGWLWVTQVALETDKEMLWAERKSTASG